MAKAIDPHKRARQKAKAQNIMPGSVVGLISEMRRFMESVEYNAWVDANIGEWEPWESIEAKMREKLKEFHAVKEVQSE